MSSLKDVLAVIGWRNMVSYRAKNLLAAYRAKKRLGYLPELEHEISTLRRNRALRKFTTKQFADAIQIEFNAPYNAHVELLPEYYKSTEVPYRFRFLHPKEFRADAVLKPYMESIDYTEYSVDCVKFGFNNLRITAGYLKSLNTIYVSVVRYV